LKHYLGCNQVQIARISSFDESEPPNRKTGLGQFYYLLTSREQENSDDIVFSNITELEIIVLIFNFGKKRRCTKII
jgi:hypothetical protein